MKQTLTGLLLASLIFSLAYGLPNQPQGHLPEGTTKTAIIGYIDDFSVIPAVVALQDAKPGETVVITIDSPGGSVVSGARVLEAMKTTKASSVVAYIETQASSMANEIAVSADAMYVQPTSLFVIHTMSDQFGKVAPSYDELNRGGYSPKDWIDTETLAIELFGDLRSKSTGVYSNEQFIKITELKDVVVFPVPLFYIKELIERSGQTLNDVQDVNPGLFVSGLDDANDLADGMLFHKLISGSFHPIVLVLPRGVK